MGTKICPLLLASRGPSKTLMEQILCREDDCAWFYQGIVTKEKDKEEKVGMCSILKIAGGKIPSEVFIGWSKEDWR